jgi:hypothetical protein
VLRSPDTLHVQDCESADLSAHAAPRTSTVLGLDPLAEPVLGAAG